MAINWTGCWEKKSGRIICVWMLVWHETKDSLAGCIAGYSGGGAFQCEKFLGSPDDLVLDCDDDLATVGTAELVNSSENCLDVVLQMHDADLWFDTDNLVLRDDSDLPNVSVDGDLIFSGKKDVPNWAKPLFERTGLTARPKSFV